MIGFDTNILVRYLAQDDPIQSPKARELIERRLTERVLQTDVLAVESEQEVLTAMIALKEGRGSFADALVGALGAQAGCSRTLTFDRRASLLAEFELL
jgi:predicted nucleic-acid-binding protein